MQEIKREEVIISQIVVLLLTLLTSFGILEFGPEELAENAGVITSAIIVIYEAITAIILRFRVTPVNDPRDKDGNRLVPDDSNT